MKIVIAIIAAFFILEGSSLTTSEQQSELGAPVTLQSFERVKRGCSCGPYGCSCTLKDTDDSFLKVFVADEQPEELKRSKRGGFFCGANGCGCTLKNAEEISEETENNPPEALIRSKRQCGPYGCSTGGGRCNMWGCTSE